MNAEDLEAAAHSAVTGWLLWECSVDVQFQVLGFYEFLIILSQIYTKVSSGQPEHFRCRQVSFYNLSNSLNADVFESDKRTSSVGLKLAKISFISNISFSINKVVWTLIFVPAAVADAAMTQTQTVYTEATPEQLEELQQQGIHYDVITFSNE